MIEVRNLVKRYGNNTALKKISFTVERGHIYGFLGPNGAGKSTTMNIITGCLAATEGEVKIDGHDIFEDPVAAKKCIGYLPEQPPLYPDMTPAEYLDFVAEAKGIPAKDKPEHVARVMEMTGLSAMKNRLIKNLSKGYRQRVGIAQAILGDPEVIILDEPTVGLDPKQIIEIRELILALGRRHTVILSSHILQEISAVCDYIIIISRGNVVASDTLENIRAKLAEDKKLELLIRGEEGRVRMALNDIEGIASYEVTLREDGIVRAVVDCKKYADIREALFFAFSELRYPILEMSDISATLEDVFLKLTEESTVGEEEPEEAALPYDVREAKADEDDSDDSEDAYGSEDADEASDDDDDDDYTPMFGAKEE